MNKARAFFYVCAGVLCLALSYQLGATRAVAQSMRNMKTTEVRAQAFVLVDSSGNPRGQWETRADGTVVLSLAESGRASQVSLGMGKDGRAYLSVMSPNSEKGSILVTCDANGDPSVSMRGADHKRMLGLSVFNGEPTLLMSGFREEVMAMFSIDHGDTPKLYVRNNQGEARSWPSQ